MLATLLSAAILGAVNFVHCPKCEKRIRLSDDGQQAFVNLDRIRPGEKEAMRVRAERLLALGRRPGQTDDSLLPLMGWSSWNTFAVGISEEIILGVARAMATNGLKSAGYRYVNIDDGFFNGHGSDGRLRFHPKRFPNGLKGTVDGIHALGLKAGIYSDAGSNTCGSAWNGDSSGLGAGLYGHDTVDCRLHFNELGFDFIKVDYCGGLAQKLDERTRYGEIAAAIRATGRTDVRLNICRWAFPGTWAAAFAGSWRTTKDIRASWKSVRDIIAENLYLSAYASPGHFNDLDMLEVGQRKGDVTSAFVGGNGDVGFTEDEEVTHFGMWCFLSSPLVLGCDVRAMRPSSRELATNPYLLAMNQNDLGLQGYVVRRTGEAYVLTKDADVRHGPARFVALYNAGETEHVFKVSARDVDLGGRVDVFDLVSRADTGDFTEVLSVRVAPHASRFFRFDAERRLDREVYEAETAYLTDYSEIDETSYGTIAGNRRKGRAYPFGEKAASGGVAVVNLGRRATNDLVWKDVRVSTAGTYRLTFRCRPREGRSFSVQIDDLAPRPLRVAGSPETFAEVSVDAALEAGDHTVRLFNPTDPMPDIDRMDIRPKAERPLSILCEGGYGGHLQGVDTDGTNIWWSFTSTLVRTDLTGRLLARTEAPRHQGDLCVRSGRLYVAVNRGRFNQLNEAVSEVMAYDATTLAKIQTWPVDVPHGAGGMTEKDGHFYVVGGLPATVEQNYVYEYDGDFRLVKRHELDTGFTLMGIQTAMALDGKFYFGIYGATGDPEGVLACSADLRSFTRHTGYGAMGMLRLNGTVYTAEEAHSDEWSTNPKTGRLMRLRRAKLVADPRFCSPERRYEPVRRNQGLVQIFYEADGTNGWYDAHYALRPDGYSPLFAQKDRRVFLLTDEFCFFSPVPAVGIGGDRSYSAPDLVRAVRRCAETDEAFALHVPGTRADAAKDAKLSAALNEVRRACDTLGVRFEGLE